MTEPEKKLTVNDILSNSPHFYINNFMKSYFSDVIRIINHEKEFFTKHNLQKTKIDYSRLKRFVVTALRRFHELDQKFLSGLL
jgi:hypothetical protein